MGTKTAVMPSNGDDGAYIGSLAAVVETKAPQTDAGADADVGIAGAVGPAGAAASERKPSASAGKAASLVDGGAATSGGIASTPWLSRADWMLQSVSTRSGCCNGRVWAVMGFLRLLLSVLILGLDFRDALNVADVTEFVFIAAPSLLEVQTGIVLWCFVRGNAPASLAELLANVQLPLGSPEHAALEHTARRWVVGAVAGAAAAILSSWWGSIAVAIDGQGSAAYVIGGLVWWRFDATGSAVLSASQTVTWYCLAVQLVAVAVASRALSLHVVRFGAVDLGLTMEGQLAMPLAPGVRHGGSHATVGQHVGPATGNAKEVARVAQLVDGGAVDSGADYSKRDLFVWHVRRVIQSVDDSLHRLWALPTLLMTVLASAFVLAAVTIVSDSSTRGDGFTVWTPWSVAVALLLAATLIPAATVNAAVVKLEAAVTRSARDSVLDRKASAASVSREFADLEVAIATALPYCGLRILGEKRLTWTLLASGTSLYFSVALLWANQVRSA